MILPGVLLVFVFSYIPMLGSYIAFKDFKPALGLFGSDWIGWGNFVFVFKIPDFLQIIWNTIYISLLKIVGLIIVPVTVALMLNEIRAERLKKAIQTLIYLPHFLSWVILSGILIDILSPSTGIVNQILLFFGMEPIFFLGNQFWFPFTLVLTEIWKNFGFGTIIYLAALTNIDPSLYEAAAMDGAGRFRKIWNITLPGILPIIVLMTVLSFGDILNAGFEQVLNLYSAQVYKTGDIIDTFIYRLGLEQAQFGPATAVGLFKSLISFIFVSVSYFLADRLVNYRIF
jgi:putative aldouronate transport system permease protein